MQKHAMYCRFNGIQIKEKCLKNLSIHVEGWRGNVSAQVPLEVYLNKDGHHQTKNETETKISHLHEKIGCLYLTITSSQLCISREHWVGRIG